MNRSLVIGAIATTAIVVVAAMVGTKTGLGSAADNEQKTLAPYTTRGRSLTTPGQLSPPGRTSRPGHLTDPGHLSSPGQTVAECRSTDSNPGFELGAVNSNEIPCWTVVNQAGSFIGGWCLQAGTAPPQGACAGEFALVQPPPAGVQAAMTNQIGPGSHVLYQCGALRSSSVAFQLYIDNEASVFFSPSSLAFGAGPNQQFRADLVEATAIAADPFTVGSGVLLNLYQSAPGDPSVSGYRAISADAGAHVGADVCLRFAEVDNQLFFHAGVDSVQIDLRARP